MKHINVKRLSACLLICVLMIAAALCVHAQDGRTLTGTVVMNGRTDEAVTVVLAAAATGEEIGRTTLDYPTDSFTFTGVPAGDYELLASAPGFRPVRQAVTVADTDADVTLTLCLFGDVNGDGKLSTVDAAKVNAFVQGLTTLTAYQAACVDVLGTDGMVTNVDAACLNSIVRGVFAPVADECIHSFTILLPAAEPTCTTPGWTAGEKCRLCGLVLVGQEILPALGHNVVIDPAVPATATETGLTEGSHCARCGLILVEQTRTDENMPEDTSDVGTERVYLEGTYTDGYWIQNNGKQGSITGHGGYMTFSVTPGDTYYITGTHYSSLLPLGVMFDAEDSVIGIINPGTGSYEAVDDYMFTAPSTCVRIAINGRAYYNPGGRYPSAYCKHTARMTDREIADALDGKQSKSIVWNKAEYEYVSGTYMRVTSDGAVERTVSSASYVAMTYDKTKRYRFYGYVPTDKGWPLIVCCADNNLIIKTFGLEPGQYTGAEFDIPENTKIIYVNGHALMPPDVEYADERDSGPEAGRIGVFFGDSITQGVGSGLSSHYKPREDYPTIVGNLLDCQIYNGGIGGSTWSGTRTIDLKNVIDCVVEGDFTTVFEGLDAYSIQKSAAMWYEEIMSLDFNTVDFVVFAAGTNDWMFNYSTEAVKNAIGYCINKLVTAYPHLRVYVLTPIYRYGLGSDKDQDSDTYRNPSSGLMLHDMCDAIIEAAHAAHVPCKDMYYESGLSQYNRSTYYNDVTHPNAKGYAVMGDKIARFIAAN